jgi:phosphatidylserine/phosphatidylglycerophosphate/cardiolipin synthase-like enzyme
MRSRDDIPLTLLPAPGTNVLRRPPRGEVELVVDGEHLARVVVNGMLKAQVSLAVATADFKAMLVPGGDAGRARGNGSGRRGRRAGAISIVEHFRRLAEAGVEIRVLHAGVPSGPALRELRRALPERIRIRRCPRLHAKAVIVDCAAMYLGSANITGAGLGAKAASRRNFELGIWARSHSLIDPVLESFNAIWEGRHCDTCGRRNICPVPLEEPEL